MKRVHLGYDLIGLDSYAPITKKDISSFKPLDELHIEVSLRSVAPSGFHLSTYYLLSLSQIIDIHLLTLLPISQNL